MSKKKTPATEQFQQNCQMRNEMLIAAGSLNPMVNCADLEAPRGLSMADMRDEAESLQRARTQLHKIDNRRAY